jgi:hypothetical protein
VESITLTVRRSPFFENILSNDSILKISVHTDDINSGATSSELDLTLFPLGFFEIGNTGGIGLNQVLMK